MVHEEMSFNDISYLQFWWPFCSAEWKHSCNFGRRHYEKHFSEIILDLDQLFRRRRHLKIILISSLVNILFGRVEPFVQFWIWTSSSGGDINLRDFSSPALVTFCTAEWNHLCNFGCGPVVQGDII